MSFQMNSYKHDRAPCKPVAPSGRSD